MLRRLSSRRIRRQSRKKAAVQGHIPRTKRWTSGIIHWWGNKRHEQGLCVQPLLMPILGCGIQSPTPHQIPLPFPVGDGNISTERSPSPQKRGGDEAVLYYLKFLAWASISCSIFPLKADASKPSSMLILRHVSVTQNLPVNPLPLMSAAVLSSFHEISPSTEPY